ncbi:hypothetical protein [Roseburia rectibacter]|nr:hypothetical protein [Roseburia rectibacter]
MRRVRVSVVEAERMYNLSFTGVKNVMFQFMRTDAADVAWRQKS